MKKVYKYRKKLLLEQGKQYAFYFQKKVLLPDNLWYYVLIDPFGNKHLLPHEYYSHYNLKTGNTYLCKVDKINCLGRIFIEPPHPVFEEGKSYAFKYSKTISKKHKSGNIYSYHVFVDKNCEKALMNADDYLLSDNLKTGFHHFTIVKISKAVVYIISESN